MVILQLEQQPILIQAIFNGLLEDVRWAWQLQEDVNYQDCEKRSPLHAASFKGDPEIVAFLLARGARVNVKDSRWITPLHRACCFGSSKLVSILLEHQADVTARDRQWQTPLHVAAANNSVECVEQLLNCVPNPNVTDRMGRTALHHASVNGHNDVIELLISKGCIVNACDKKDCRPIHCAAHMGNVETIQLLIRNGADINAKDRNQYTPLHVAAASGMMNACRMLLRCGAEKDVKNAYGNTALHIACLNGHLSVCNSLVFFGADPEAVNYRGQTPLHIAAASTHGVDCLNYLVEKNVNINYQSMDGRSPLHMTAIHGRFTRSKTLIDRGAIVDCTDKNGCTALHIAAQYGHDLLSNTLLSCGADPFKKGFSGRTPLHMGCLSGYVECCRKFLQVGADLNAVDDSGKTPVHCAAYKGSVECLDLLVSNGASFQLIDDIGRIPLHYASVQGHYPCVFTLVGLGSNVNLCDEEGCSPLHLAAAYDTKGECVEYLLRHKADATLKDRKGYTPIHYAVAGGNCVGLGFLLSVVGNNYVMYGTDMPLTTPLHLAAKNGDQEILRLLQPYFHDTNIRTSSGSTPLLLAAKSGHTHCVQMLMRYGAKVAIADNIYHMTPVHFSAQNGHMHCLALLLDNAEDSRVVDFRDSLQRTALMLAVTGRHTESALTLLKCGADSNIADGDLHSSIFRAVVNGQDDALQLLISHGAQVKVPDVNSKTILHLAAGCGHYSCLKTIVDNMDDADLKLFDKQDCTALHWACYNGNSKCVSFLLEQDVFKQFEGNVFTPVHCAAFAGAERCLELLCTYYGKDIVKLKDSRNRTPLHIAALHGHVDCAKYLLEQGAEIECKDNDGRTPLTAAAQHGQSQIIDLLLTNKADVSAYDNNGNTPLHLACLKCHSDSASLLLDNIDDKDIVNMINNDRKTPLHLSARNGLVNVTRQLICKGSSVLALDSNGMTPALCCAPNASVAQCLALILANYAICSQDNKDKAHPSNILPAIDPNLYKSRKIKKLKIYDTKVSQTEISLIREPDFFEYRSSKHRHHSRTPIHKKTSISSCSNIFTDQKVVAGFKSHTDIEEILKHPSAGSNTSDYFILETYMDDDSNKERIEKKYGHELHRSYSDMFIACKDSHYDATSFKKIVSAAKLKKSSKLNHPEAVKTTQTTRSDSKIRKNEHLHKSVKDVAQQIVNSYSPCGSNVRLEGFTKSLVRLARKFEVIQDKLQGDVDVIKDLADSTKQQPESSGCEETDCVEENYNDLDSSAADIPDDGDCLEETGDNDVGDDMAEDENGEIIKQYKDVAVQSEEAAEVGIPNYDSHIVQLDTNDRDSPETPPITEPINTGPVTKTSEGEVNAGISNPLLEITCLEQLAGRISSFSGDTSENSPENIILKGFNVMKNIKDMNSIAHHIESFNKMWLHFPDCISECAEIMRHIISTVKQNKEWQTIDCNLPVCMQTLKPSKLCLKIQNVGMYDSNNCDHIVSSGETQVLDDIDVTVNATDVISGTISLVPFVSVQKEMEITLDCINEEIFSGGEEINHCDEAETQVGIDDAVEETSIEENSECCNESEMTSADEIDSITESEDMMTPNETLDDDEIKNFKGTTDEEKEVKVKKRSSYTLVNRKKPKSKENLHCILS